MKYKKILIGLTTAVSTAVLAEWFTSNNVLTVSRIAVHNKKIPQSFDGFRIVQISDRHCSDFGKDNERLIRKIKYQYPDIVVMTGDMVDSQNSKIGSFYKLVEKLAQKYPIYYVVGNHELNLGKGKLSRMIAKLKGLGVIVLDNSNESIRRNGDELVVSGLWNDLSFYPQSDKKVLQQILTTPTMIRAIGQADKSKYNILLTHSPFDFEVYSSWGADLTLSGHVHGGMIRLPKLGGIFSPEYNLFPKYQNGIYSDGKSLLVVNRGLGSSRIPVRFLNKPEITVVTLKSGQDRVFD
ncbi:MAG TPA: metallophosphoesterase [Clostridia bacterium]|nr:metallophosphoesterase [Clostridia bacterium]